MSSLEILKSIYKPYRYTKSKSAMIVESTNGKFIIKKKNKDLYELFNYLENRGFNNFAKIINNYDNQENVFEYAEENYLIKEQKFIHLSEIIASLHNKTVYYKKTKLDSIKKIYEDLQNNITFLKMNYDQMFKNIIKEEFIRPDKYLFSRNYYKIIASLNFSENKLNEWYIKYKDIDKIRVSVVHNNLSMEHFMENNEDSKLISWDNYKIDSPVIDLINLYHKEYLNYDFTEFFEKYLSIFELLDMEKELFVISISIPLKIIFENNIFESTKNVRSKIDYVYTTEEIIKKLFTND